MVVGWSNQQPTVCWLQIMSMYFKGTVVTAALWKSGIRLIHVQTRFPSTAPWVFFLRCLRIFEAPNYLRIGSQPEPWHFPGENQLKLLRLLIRDQWSCQFIFWFNCAVMSRQGFDWLCITCCRFDPLKLLSGCLNFCLFEPANHRLYLSCQHSWLVTPTC